MAGSSTNLISGSIELEIVFPQSPSPDHLGQLDHVVSTFLTAVESGMYDPGRLVKRETESTAVSESEPPSRRRRFAFRVESLPLGTFRVLSGMFLYFSNMHCRLERSSASGHPDTEDLLSVTAPFPPVARKPVFDVTVATVVDIAPPLVIHVEFQQSPPAEVRGRFVKVLSCWDGLLSGGYPYPGDPPGSSAVGAGSTRFISPTLLQHDLESYRADTACFSPVINLINRWSEKYPVSSVDIR